MFLFCGTLCPSKMEKIMSKTKMIRTRIKSGLKYNKEKTLNKLVLSTTKEIALCF